MNKTLVKKEESSISDVLEKKFEKLTQMLSEKGLSNREIEVTKHVMAGESNKEIADELFVTTKTIKFHLMNISKKMRTRGRAELIVWCLPHI